MTVSENVSPKVIVVGPYAIGDTIPITFEYTEYNDIKIDVDGSALVYNQDYEVYLQSVTLKVAVAANKKVTVYRDTPLDQQAEFPQNRKFNSAKMDDALDKLCMQNQEQQEKLNRAILAPISEEDFNGTLPTPKANEVLQWNSTANQLINYDLRGEIKAIDDKVDEAISTAGGATSIANAATDTANSAVSTANSATAAANNAVSTANTASSNATAAVNTANAADTKANTAISTANEASSTAAGAVVTANSAASQAAEASDTADEAKEIAEGIDGKATQALSTANTAASQVAEAKAKADAAKAAADAVVGTAAEAKATATEAKTTANTAKATADGVDAKAQEALDKVNEVVSKKLPNVVMTSGLTANGGILSGFNSTQYAKFPFVVDLDESDFEIDFKFTTSDNVIDTQAIIDSRFGLAVYIDTYNLQMCLSSTGESWDIGTDRGSHRLEENTTYYCKLTFEDNMYILSISEDDITYEMDITTGGLAGLYPRTIYIGGGNEDELGAAFPLDGTIDLNFAKLIIDDEVKWNGMDITGLATKANVSLSNIDSEGQAKFDAKQDTLVSGTNIKTLNNQSLLGSGNVDIDSLPSQEGQNGKYLTTDGESASWEEIQQSSYHPPILSCMWSDHIINDIQWLRADTFSWQSGDVYTTVYNKLVEEHSTGTEETEGDITFKRTTNDFKIADASQESNILNKYNTDGIAWYYILDTTNKRFKLPRTKWGFEGLRTNVGDNIAESLPNIKGRTATYVASSYAGDSGALSHTDAVAGSAASAFSPGINNLLSFDASRSSSTYQDNAPVQERATQMYLYFYVGEYAQSAIEQTAGITSEQLNGKADVSTVNTLSTTVNTLSTTVDTKLNKDHSNDTKPYLKTCYINGTSGYNIWSNGYCEQWGRFSGYNTSVTITFTKKWKDTKYGIYQGEIGRAGTDPYVNGVYYKSLATNSVVAVLRNDGTNTYMWKAYGYLAEGQY